MFPHFHTRCERVRAAGNQADLEIPNPNFLDFGPNKGLQSGRPVPPRGALEGAQVCGAAGGGAGDAALKPSGFRRVKLRRGRCGGLLRCSAASAKAAQAAWSWRAVTLRRLGLTATAP